VTAKLATKVCISRFGLVKVVSNYNNISKNNPICETWTYFLTNPFMQEVCLICINNSVQQLPFIVLVFHIRQGIHASAPKLLKRKIFIYGRRSTVLVDIWTHSLRKTVLLLLLTSNTMEVKLRTKPFFLQWMRQRCQYKSTETHKNELDHGMAAPRTNVIYTFHCEFHLKTS